MVTTRSRHSKVQGAKMQGATAEQEQGTVAQQCVSTGQEHQYTCSHHEDHQQRMAAYRQEWAATSTPHGKIINTLRELFVYVNCLAGNEILDYSERLLLLIILVVGGVLGLAGAYKQASAVAWSLEPLLRRVLDAVKH